jgi:hypothetical protein
MKDILHKINNSLSWMIIVSIVIHICLYFFDKKIDTTLITINIAIIAVVMTYLQLIINNEQHKKYSALKAMHEDRKESKKALNNLKTSIDYKTNTTKTNKYIQERIEDNTGNTIQNDIELVLNSYEYFAVGIKHHIFDESTIETLIGQGWINIYNFFADYIKENRIEKNHLTLWIEMEKQAIIWIKNKQNA